MNYVEDKGPDEGFRMPACEQFLTVDHRVFTAMTKNLAVLAAENASLRARVAELEGKASDWQDLLGAAPDCTGGLSSEAFVRAQRDAWDSPDPRVLDAAGDDGHTTVLPPRGEDFLVGYERQVEKWQASSVALGAKASAAAFAETKCRLGDGGTTMGRPADTPLSLTLSRAMRTPGA